MDRVGVIHHEEGSWWAESSDAPGWFGATDTYEESHYLAEEGIRFALERDEVTIEHFAPAGTATAA